MAKRPRGDGPIDAAAAYEAAKPLARFPYRELQQLVDGRMRIIGYQASRRLDEAPILLPVEMVARAVAPEFHKIAGPALLSLLTPWPSAGKRPDWYVESPGAAADREARERERSERVIPPKAIDWRRGQIEIHGMVFTECRVILAEDLESHARGGIPHGHQELVVSKACEELWVDGARDWLASGITLPIIADELRRRAGPKSVLASIRRSSFEKAIGKARSEARKQAGRKP